MATVVLFVTSTLAADGNARILAPSGKLRAALYPGTPTSVLYHHAVVVACPGCGRPRNPELPEPATLA